MKVERWKERTKSGRSRENVRLGRNNAMVSKYITVTDLSRQTRQTADTRENSCSCGADPSPEQTLHVSVQHENPTNAILFDGRKLRLPSLCLDLSMHYHRLAKQLLLYINTTNTKCQLGMYARIMYSAELLINKNALSFVLLVVHRRPYKVYKACKEGEYFWNDTTSS